MSGAAIRQAARSLLAASCLGILAVGVAAPAADRTTARHATDSEPEAYQDVLLLLPSRPLLVRLLLYVDGDDFHQVWQRRFDNLFDEHDPQHTGQLALSDAAAVARLMAGAFGAGKPDNDGDLRRLADSSDGHVQRDALLDYLNTSAAAFNMRAGLAAARGAAPALFGLLDADGDARLVSDELTRAYSRLAPRDFDDDHLIVPAELVVDPTMNDVHRTSNDHAANDEGDPTDDAATHETWAGPALALTASSSHEAAARRILRHYDRDRDGQLATAAKQSEIAWPQSLIEQLDADGDTVLTAAELTAFFQRPPDVVLPITLGLENGALRSRLRRATRVPDDARLRRRIGGGFEVDLGDAELILRRDNRLPGADLLDRVRFTPLDADKNGYLNQKELDANPLIRGKFTYVDRDNDGKVFAHELADFVELERRAAAGRLLLVVYDHGQDLLTLLDSDGNGLLSPRELQEADKLIERNDRNGDGVLSGSEIPARITLLVTRGVDFDQRTAALRGSDNKGSHLPRNTEGPLWFRKMDRNSDGVVSGDEFLGPADALSALDSSGDGFIDATEAAAARPPK